MSWTRKKSLKHPLKGKSKKKPKPQVRYLLNMYTFVKKIALHLGSSGFSWNELETKSILKFDIKILQISGKNPAVRIRTGLFLPPESIKRKNHWEIYWKQSTFPRNLPHLRKDGMYFGFYPKLDKTDSSILWLTAVRILGSEAKN